MANLIQATVYEIDGSALQSGPITLDFPTSFILILEAFNITNVNAAIQVYNNPNNALSFKTYYVSETVEQLTSAANQGVVTLTQATVLEINNDPQPPGGNQYSFPSKEIVISETINPTTGVNATIQFKNVLYAVAETQASLFASSVASPGVNLYNYYNLY